MNGTSSTITVHVPRGLKTRLEKLSKTTSRSQSKLTLEALQTYLEVFDWQIQAIEKGVSDAEAGRLVIHDKVDSWLASWGKGKELEPPKWK